MTAMMNTVFHVDLSDADPEEDYWISTGGRKQMLQKHTEETRALLLGEPHLMAKQSRLTHFTQEPLQMPADQVIRVHVRTSLKNQPGAKGVWGVTHSAIHIPPPEHELQALQSSGRAHSEVLDYVSTAKNLVFHHPELITKDRRLADIIYGYMDDDKNISLMFEEVAMHMRQLGPPTETSGWAKLVPFTPEENPETGYDGKTTYYSQEPVQSVIDKMGPVMTAMMIATKNDLELQGKKWTLQEGTAVQSSSGHDQLTLAAQLTAEGENWRVSLANTTTVSGMYVTAKVANSLGKQVQLTFNNIFIRYLGAYIRFFDANGNAMKVPDWKPDDNWVATLTTDILNNQYDDLRYLGHIGPVNNIFAIPIVGDPGKLDVTVTFPKGAVRADIFGSGLGTGPNLWPKTPLVGGVLTGVFNLGVPAFMLGFQVAAQSYKPLYDIVEELSGNKAFVSTVVVIGGAFYTKQFTESAIHGEMNWGAFTSLSSLIFNKAATRALIWVEATTVAEKAAEQIPFAGWIMIAINICLGVAQLAQTIVEVATSPWNIRNAVATSITTNVTLGPDPRHKAFPQGSAGAKVSYTVKMIYKDEKRPTVSQTHQVPEGSTATLLKAAFPNNTLGGQVRFEADYHIDNWLAGKATTGWIDNDNEHASYVSMFIVEFPKPLDEKSVYKHASILTFRNGAYSWMPTDKAPVSTIANTDTTTGGNGISDWSGIALSQKMGMIGFAWRAAGLGVPSCVSGQTGQLAAMQNINIPGRPMTNVKFPTCAFDGSTQLIYDPFPPKFLMENGQWKLDPKTQLPMPDPGDAKLGNYYVDPRKADVAIGEGGGFHLRQVALDAPGPFDVNGTLSWGRFRFFPDSFALHPTGYLIAISTKIGKIQVTRLEESGKPDNQVPVAFSYAGEAHLRDRKGLLFHPIAVACAYDGTVLILEDTKSSTGTEDKIVSRIQAFDLFGNPVNRFIDGQGQPSPFLQIAEDRDIRYLDMAVVGGEKLTYMYVLYFRGDGTKVDDYHMTIYQYGTEAPAKNPLVTTDRLSAARLTVDMWHTVYTLNFEMTTDGNGNPAGPKGGSAPAAGRTVPSVSQWLPPIPSK